MLKDFARKIGIEIRKWPLELRVFFFYWRVFLFFVITPWVNNKQCYVHRHFSFFSFSLKKKRKETIETPWNALCFNIRTIWNIRLVLHPLPVNFTALSCSLTCSYWQGKCSSVQCWIPHCFIERRDDCL